MNILIDKPSVARYLGLTIYTVLILILAACQTERASNQADLPEQVESVTLTPRPIIAKSTESDQSLVSPIAEQTPTIVPSATPKRIVTVATDDRWSSLIQDAVDRLNNSDSLWEWRLVSGKAEIALAMDSPGIPFISIPIALAVEFSSPVDSISLDDVNGILAGEDEHVVVLPWSEMTPDLKSLKIDGLGPADTEYPLQQTWVVTSVPGLEDAAVELAKILDGLYQANNVVSLAAVGDIMLDRALGYALRQSDLNFPFTLVSPQLTTADIAIGNIESALGASGQPAKKSYTFQAPPAAAESLSIAGFDIVNLANNHAMDFGADSLLEGIELLKANGILTIGAGANLEAARSPAVIERGGLRVAFLGYVDVPIEVAGFDTRSWQATDMEPGLAWADPNDIRHDVEKAKQMTDLVVVTLHSGFEYIEAPSDNQKQAARTAIDAGADLVVGHHAHVLQGIEFYREGVIAYGLGNFAFEIDGDPTTTILNVWLDADGVREIDLVPAIIQFGGQPRLATGWEAAAIKQRIYELSNLIQVP